MSDNERERRPAGRALRRCGAAGRMTRTWHIASRAQVARRGADKTGIRPRRLAMPTLPSRARPLLASVAAGASMTAAIVVAGLAAIAGFATVVEPAAIARDQGTNTITLADVPRPNLPSRLAPGPLAMPASPPVSAARPASAGPTSVRGVERRRKPRHRRSPRRPNRADASRPQTSAPPAQGPAAPAASAPSDANGREPVRTPASSSPSSTHARPRSTAPAHPRPDARVRGRGKNQSANVQSVQSPAAPDAPRGAAHGQRPGRGQGKALGHGRAAARRIEATAHARRRTARRPVRTRERACRARKPLRADRGHGPRR